MRFILAMAGGALMAVAGLLIILTGTHEILPLGWVFLLLGLLFTAANYAMRNKLR